MAIEGRGDARKGGGSGWAWWAAARAPSSAPSIASPRASMTSYELVAGALSSTPEKARRSGEALGLAADRIYDDYESMAKAEAEAAGRDRGGGDRHAEPHARRADLRLPQGGNPRHLRQAADGVAGGSQEDAGRGREVGPHLRPHPQLHRLSACAPDAGDGSRRRTGRNPPRPGRISAGLADRPD